MRRSTTTETNKQTGNWHLRQYAGRYPDSTSGAHRLTPSYIYKDWTARASPWPLCHDQVQHDCFVVRRHNTTAPTDYKHNTSTHVDVISTDCCSFLFVNDLRSLLIMDTYLNTQLLISGEGNEKKSIHLNST